LVAGWDLVLLPSGYEKEEQSHFLIGLCKFAPITLIKENHSLFRQIVATHKFRLVAIRTISYIYKQFR